MQPSRSRASLSLSVPQCLVLAGLVVCVSGCVRRTLTVNTEPQGALVYINDEEIGRSPASTDFTWYGDYDIVIRKDGHETVQTHEKINAPWYQLIPFDFFAEVLWPGQIHDERFLSYTLTQRVEPSRDELIEAATAFREQAQPEAE